jgi:hypothetical protein
MSYNNQTDKHINIFTLSFLSGLKSIFNKFLLFYLFILAIYLSNRSSLLILSSLNWTHFLEAVLKLQFALKLSFQLIQTATQYYLKFHLFFLVE